MTTFAVTNRLMELVNDNVKAYGIANEFVLGDPNKLAVFERCWNRANNITQGENYFTQRASLAKDEANQIWQQVYI